MLQTRTPLLHVGIGDRGPPGQDRRPDLRRDSRRRPARRSRRDASRARRSSRPASRSSPGRSRRRPTCDFPSVVRHTIKEIGYTRAKFGFDYETCAVISSIDPQSPDIAQGVDTGRRGRPGLDVRLRRARDRGADAAAADARAPPRASGSRRRGGTERWTSCGRTASRRSPSSTRGRGRSRRDRRRLDAARGGHEARALCGRRSSKRIIKPVIPAGAPDAATRSTTSTRPAASSSAARRATRG